MEELLKLAIFGSLTWAIICLAVMFILFLISEHVEHGGIAVLSIVAFLIVNHYWGNIPIKPLLTWVNILLYFGIGFIFSIIRSYFYGRLLAKKGYKEVELNEEIKNNVFRWWFMWPISLIYWTIFHLIFDVFDFVFDKFESTFRYFINLGLNSKAKK